MFYGTVYKVKRSLIKGEPKLVEYKSFWDWHAEPVLAKLSKYRSDAYVVSFTDDSQQYAGLAPERPTADVTAWDADGNPVDDERDQANYGTRSKDMLSDDLDAEEWIRAVNAQSDDVPF